MFIEVMFRPMPQSGGGRVMAWWVTPTRRGDPDTSEGWQDILKLVDLRLWPDEVPLSTDSRRG